jgi:O-antigen/teichoic acid export membrane protein
MPDAKVAKNTAYLLTAAVGQKLLALVYFMVVAHLAGVEGTGKFVLATSFAAMFAVLIDLGLGNILVREVAKDRERVGDYLGSVLGVKGILAVVVFGLAQLAAWLLGYGADMRLMILVASVAMVLESVQVTFYAALRGLQNLRPEAVGVIVGQVVVLIAGTALFLVMRTPLALIIALVLNTAWNVVWAGFVLVRRFGVSLRPRLDSDVMRLFASLAAPFALAAVFSRVYSYVDSVMLSKLGTVEDVGLYGAAYKLTFAFIFLPSSLAAALYPAMSEYYHRDRRHLAGVYADSFKYLLLVAAPVAFGISALAEPILRLVFSDAFASAAPALRVIVFTLPFAFLYWPTGALLNACDRQARNTTAMGVTMAVNVAMNVFLLPRYGALGAAIASLVSNAVLLTLGLAFIRGAVDLDVRKMARSVGQSVFAASFMGLTVSLLYPAVGLIPVIAFGALVYFAVIFAVGAVTVPEFKELLALFLRRGTPAETDVA